MEKNLNGQNRSHHRRQSWIGAGSSAEASPRLGAHTALIARRPDPLNQVAETIGANGGAASIYPCDVSDAESVKATAARIRDAFGAVDILINNAGIPAPRTFEETNIADWDEVIGVNLSGVFYLTRALWDCLLSAESATVVNISGTAGLRGGGSPAYGSSKFGLTGLKLRHRPSRKRRINIRSTILYPGGMDTGWRGAPNRRACPAARAWTRHVVADMVAHLVASPPRICRQ